MVIHIEFDINITDHNGIVLQSSRNHYKEDVSSNGQQDKDTVLGIDFNYFLAEYLTSSGFFLREKLMKGYSSGKLKRHAHNKAIKEEITSIELDDEDMPDLLKASELEIKIRIGNNKVIVGKIPLKLDANRDPEAGSNIISDSLAAEEAAIDGNTYNDESSISDMSPDICNFLNYSMMRAIEKYEDNIYSIWYEASTLMDPATDESVTST